MTEIQVRNIGDLEILETSNYFLIFLENKEGSIDTGSFPEGVTALKQAIVLKALRNVQHKAHHLWIILIPTQNSVCDVRGALPGGEIRQVQITSKQALLDLHPFTLPPSLFGVNAMVRGVVLRQVIAVEETERFFERRYGRFNPTLGNILSGAVAQRAMPPAVTVLF